MDEKSIYKHLMRINEALYRVTDLLPDQEPVKWMARKKAMEAFSLFAEDSPALFLASRMKKREEFTAAIHQLLDLLEFSSHNTFISHINFEVLSREYRLFLKETVSQQTIASATSDLAAAASSAEIEGIISLFPPRAEKAENMIGGANQDADLRQSSQSTINVRKEKEALSMQKEEELSTDERRKRIFSYILQKEKGITMQELLEIFKGSVNQRTLQRDLTALIERGRVKTNGVRRWRTYNVV